MLSSSRCRSAIAVFAMIDAIVGAMMLPAVPATARAWLLPYNPWYEQNRVRTGRRANCGQAGKMPAFIARATPNPRILRRKFAVP
jgi:hypothetical protein